MASSCNVVILTSDGRLSHLDDGTVSKMFKHTARHVMKDPAVASVLATSAPQPVKLSTTGASSPRSALRQPDLVHRGAPLRYSAMVRLLILGALFHPNGLIARGAVGPLSLSLHLSTRLVAVSTGNSTNEEGS